MKKTYSITVFLLILTVVFFACNEKGNRMPFVRIAGGDSVGCLGEKQEKVITTQEEWENFIIPLPICGINHLCGVEINFETHQVIIIVDEERPNLMWSIDVTRIVEYFDRIVVTVAVFDPKGSAVLNITKQPYRIVKMPATRKSIEFNYVFK